MPLTLWFALWVGVLPALGNETPGGPIRFEVPLIDGTEVDLRETIDRIAGIANLVVPRPAAGIRLPVAGKGGNLGREMLSQALGAGTRLKVENGGLLVTLPEASAEVLEARLVELGRLADVEAKRQSRFGMHALRSYRPNDPGRPTICLVHGMNSSSYGFVHMIKPLEEAGFGIVVFDYAYNRDLRETCDRFANDWKAFRKKAGEKRPWIVTGHSMGSLIARDYVEGPSYDSDVTDLVLLAPVNQGSSLAKTQTLMQFIDGLKVVGGPKTADALSKLGDGLGEAANDITPGSRFLKVLNGRSRREGVAYHILAGDRGLLSTTARDQIEGRIALTKKRGGFLGGLTQMLIPNDLLDSLDEICDGTGDACVSVERTKLDGVDDHVTIHANHAELIRAPLLFSEPGPVPCVPQMLKWLGKPASKLGTDAKSPAASAITPRLN